jgi:hypothetical protein
MQEPGRHPYRRASPRVAAGRGQGRVHQRQQFFMEETEYEDEDEYDWGMVGPGDFLGGGLKAEQY